MGESVRQPYYTDDSITLFHGDCRGIVPDVDASVLVVDPPYGTGYYETDREMLTPRLLSQWVARFEAVAVFGWPEKLVELCAGAGAVPDEWIVWWPTNARTRGFNRAGLWREIECIAVFGPGDWGSLRQPRQPRTSPSKDAGARGKPQADQARMGDVWRDESPQLNPNQRGRLHPNEKPVSLMRRLLTALPAGVVLDPCAGSGSTLIAARELGRCAVGVEVDERYCKVAAARCAQGCLLVPGAFWPQLETMGRRDG